MLSWEWQHSTECSLSSLCHPEDRDVGPYLSGAIEYCNKLRVLVSIVVKHHIFATLKEQAEEAARKGIPNTLPLPFDSDQNYYSRVRTMVVKGELQKSEGTFPSYEGSLRISKDAVLESIPCPAYNGQLSETTLSAMMGYMMKQFAENLTTHVKTHAQDCVENWLNDQLRAKLTDDHYNSKSHREHIGTLKRELSSNESLSKISAAHEEYLRQLSTVKLSTAGLVALFYRLRVDIDILEASNAPPRDITSLGLYSEKDRLTGKSAHLVAIGPGIKCIFTAVRLDDPTRKPLKVTQAEYREASKLNYTMKKLGSDTNDFKKWMGDVMEKLTNAPSPKSVLRYSEYLTALGSVLARSWAYHVRPKLRQIKFYAWRRRESWMAKLVNRVKAYAGGGPVLFGNGANSGLFGKVRGCGVKGPVLEIKKRLSKQLPVIECSEFRTSKLCLDCGRVAKLYRYGVTYCTDPGHHRMANRDVAAAKKIGGATWQKRRTWTRARGVEACQQRRSGEAHTRARFSETC